MAEQRSGEARRRSDGLDPATLVAIARRYYLEEVSKVAIGEQFGLSRFQVARYLKEARERGIVRIEIEADGFIDTALSTRLTQRLNLRRGVVVGAIPDSTTTAIVRHLGRAMADLLPGIVAEGSVLGLAWSRVGASTVAQLGRLDQCTVVQLAGHLSAPDDTLGGVEMVRRAAEIAGGTAYPIYAPMIVPNAATAEGLRGTPEISEALAHADELDVAVVSIGGWGSPQSRVYQTVSAADRRTGVELGVCGEISGRLFTAAGRTVPQLLDHRVIGATLEQLRGAGEVVATAWGAESAVAVRAAVRAGWVDSLLVDEPLGRALLGAENGRGR